MTNKQIYFTLLRDIKQNGERIISDKQIQIDDQNAVRFVHVALFGGTVKITEDQKEKLEGIAISDMEIDAAEKVTKILNPDPSSKVKEAVDHGISKIDESKMPTKKNFNQTADVKEAKKQAKK